MIARSWVLAATVLAVLSPSAPGQATEAKLKAASFENEDVVFARPFYRWVAETNRRCLGKVRIDVVGPDTIKAERQWFELRAGRIDAFFGPSSFYRGELAEADVLHLARVGPAEQRRRGAWAILNRLHNEKLNAWYLTTLIAGVKFYIYTKQPLRDGRLDGLRLRAVPLYEIFVEDLGAETTYMPARDIRAALRDGKIDGFGWPLWGIDHFGWEKLVRFRHGPGFMDTAAPVLINLDRWKSLTGAQRDCLDEMAAWAEEIGPMWRAEEDRKQMAVLKNAGIRYVDLGPEFAQGPSKIFWKMLETSSPDFVKEIKPLIE